MKKSLLIIAAAILLAVLLMPFASDQSKTPENRLSPAPTPAPEVAVVEDEPSRTAEPLPEATPAPMEYVLRSKRDVRTKLEDVARIQTRLRELGFYSGESDGFYGDSTFTAVVAFQRANNLEIDGIAGIGTQKTLFEAETVYDATGRVFVPFEEAERLKNAPTPTPAPAAYTLDTFESGAALNPLLLGGTFYSDGAIDVRLTKESSLISLKITVPDVSYLRCALAGTPEHPDRQYIRNIAAKYNAVAAFAGTELTSAANRYEARQGCVFTGGLYGDSPLMVIDTDGEMHLFTAAGKEKGLSILEGSVYQALSVQKALVINGIVQGGLSESAQEPLLLFGQDADRSFLLVYSPGGLSEKYLAGIVQSMGCVNAAVVGNGGIYTGFGSLTDATLEDNPTVSNVLYFAAKGE